MTVTAPFATEEDLSLLEADVTVVLADAEPIVVADEPSLRRDPILPFLVLGGITLLAMVITAFLLSAGTI